MSNNNPGTNKRAIWAIQRRYGINQDNQPAQPNPPRKAALDKKLARRSNNRELHANPPPRKVTRARKKKSWSKKITIFIIFIILIGVGIFGYKIIAAGDKITVTDRSILGQLKDLLLSQGDTLAGENDGRINVMLIAIGGEGHKGENLADTIMLASLDPATNQASLLSIPRDLYVQVPDEEYFSKINSVHAYGEAQKKDNGPIVLNKLVEEITGQPIHYYIRVDFTAFINIIDSIGGINITIENSFFDYWHKISFPAGTEKMNGERALAYVRARYIEGPEGGDFKRAARQQQVLLAVRDKAFSVQTALDFTKLNGILNSLSDNIRTDMQLWEMKRFYELARLIEPSQIHSEVLTSGTKGVLVGGTEVLGGVPASILKPRTGNYSEIQTIAANLLQQTPESEANNIPSAAQTIAPPAPSTEPVADSPAPSPEPEVVAVKTLPTLEIRNGTTINGLAKKISGNLSSEGYEILTIGNAAVQNNPETTLYYSSEEQKENVLDLAKTLNAKTSAEFPASEKNTAADVLIILGASSK